MTASRRSIRGTERAISTEVVWKQNFLALAARIELELSVELSLDG
jgi:hypothetical protein